MMDRREFALSIPGMRRRMVGSQMVFFSTVLRDPESHFMRPSPLIKYSDEPSVGQIAYDNGVEFGDALYETLRLADGLPNDDTVRKSREALILARELYGQPCVPWEFDGTDWGYDEDEVNALTESIASAIERACESCLVSFQMLGARLIAEAEHDISKWNGKRKEEIAELVGDTNLDRNAPTREQVETLRAVIDERGKKIPPDAIQAYLRTKNRGMNKSRLNRGLRMLEARGEYEGFTRPPREKS